LLLLLGTILIVDCFVFLSENRVLDWFLVCISRVLACGLTLYKLVLLNIKTPCFDFLSKPF